MINDILSNKISKLKKLKIFFSEKNKIILFFFFFFFCEKNIESKSINLEKGEKIFQNNCLVCHQGGNNIIIAEKNLKKESLETNGMNSIVSISYQVINGKNGMPAFGGRLKEEDILEVANYILFQSEKNFEK
jgi:cytochrome c6